MNSNPAGTVNDPLETVESGFLTEQDWTRYTRSDHAVWATLYELRMGDLQRHGSRVFLDGAAAIGLERERIPRLESINRRLDARTGWNAVAVTGFIPAADFFGLLARRRFPTTITVRPKEQLEYLPEPDIFHDVFGHVPLHSHPVFANFLQRFGRIASMASSEEETRRMARLFWFTVEFGLIHEEGEVKVYGSGLISSAADSHNALGPACERRPFSLQAVMEQPFEIDHLQNVLFVIDSYDQLFEALDRI